MRIVNKKNEDVSLCFRYFPQFKKDIPALLDVINDQYEWKNETILALYFRWLGDEGYRQNFSGGFWDPISTVYGIDNQVLSNLASRYNDSRKQKHEEFEEIKIKVKQYRKEQKRQEQKYIETFSTIKKLIDETNSDDMKEIKTALEKIKTVLI